MNTSLQIRSSMASRPVTTLARVRTWIRRSRAARRARTLAQLDARTLRDIGFTRRDLVVLKVAC